MRKVKRTTSKTQSQFFQDIADIVVCQMVDIYQLKQDAKSIIPDKIGRGRSVSSSDTFEELLARCIINYLPRSYAILIDTPLTLETPDNKVRRKTCYADLVVVDKAASRVSIKGIIEAKIDLGFNSEEWYKGRVELWRQIDRVNTLRVGRNPLFDEKLSISKPKPIISHCFAVVLTAANHSERRTAFEKRFQKWECAFLIREGHPNDAPLQDATARQEFMNQVRSDSNNQAQWIKLYRFVKSL